MNREDFVKLVGADSADIEYLPAALLLRNGYACVGHYNSSANEGLASTCVLLNARMIELRGENRTSGRPSLHDFNEFLEEVVVDYCEPRGDEGSSSQSDIYGKSIPLTAIPYDEIAVVYPVVHISAIMRRAQQQEQKQLPTFLDLNKSEIIKLLRARLW